MDYLYNLYIEERPIYIIPVSKYKHVLVFTNVKKMRNKRDFVSCYAFYDEYNDIYIRREKTYRRNKLYYSTSGRRYILRNTMKLYIDPKKPYPKIERPWLRKKLDIGLQKWYYISVVNTTLAIHPRLAIDQQQAWLTKNCYLIK